MRRHFLPAALLGVGCGSPTGIPRRLPAVVSVAYGDAIGDTAVTVKDDSVIATATMRSSCGSRYAVDARNVADELMVVVTDSTAPMVCMLSSAYRTIRVAVGGAPAGKYPVQLDYRLVGDRTSSRHMLVRRVVSLP